MKFAGKGSQRDPTDTKEFHKWVMNGNFGVPTELQTIPKSASKQPPPTLRDYLIHRVKEEAEEEEEQWENWNRYQHRCRKPLDPKPYMGKGGQQRPVLKSKYPVPTAPTQKVEYYYNTMAGQTGALQTPQVWGKGEQKGGEPKPKEWTTPEPPARPITAPYPMMGLPPGKQAYAHQVFGLTPLLGAVSQPAHPQAEASEKRRREEKERNNKGQAESDDDDDENDETEEQSSVAEPKRRKTKGKKKKKHEVWLKVGDQKVRATYRA